MPRALLYAMEEAPVQRVDDLCKICLTVLQAELPRGIASNSVPMRAPGRGTWTWDMDMAAVTSGNVVVPHREVATSQERYSEIGEVAFDIVF